MKDDLLLDTKPVVFDWNIVMEQPDQAVQRLDKIFPDNSKDDGQTEKPRRALSAYNIFFQHQRGQIKKELAESSLIAENCQKNTEMHHGKMLFANLACMVATRWKTIDQETQVQYKELAGRDKNRYQ